jgi:hypothetical protein
LVEQLFTGALNSTGIHPSLDWTSRYREASSPSTNLSIFVVLTEMKIIHPCNNSIMVSQYTITRNHKVRLGF